MSKNSWITLIAIVVILVSLALVLMLILVPQTSQYITGVTYDEISRGDYTYEDSKYDPQKEENWEMYEINASDVKKGENSGTYDPGKTNPFTPDGDITIYNEPGYVDENGNTAGSGSTSSGNSGASTTK